MRAAGRGRRGTGPRLGVRLRLTLLFGGLFLASGAGLLGITYTLVNHATGHILIRQVAGSPASDPGGTGSGANGLIISDGGTGGGAPPVPQQLRAVADKSASSARAAENDALLLYSGIALAIMAAASVALGWFAAGRALRPLRRITAAAQRISAASLRERLAVQGPADDLRELADTIDGLFARLDASLDAQRQFVANASHELRTPLARSRALLEVALRHPDVSAETLRAACERAIAATEEQERLIEALLTLARSHRGLARREPMDLAGITRDVLAARARDITTRGVAVAVTLAPAPAIGDPALTERAVANLIDNAIRHNGPGGAVWVTAGQRDHSVLTVVNSGPQVPPGEIARLLQPFQRLTPGRGGSREGLGLGLSIVQAIAGAHGGALSLTPRPGGGLRAELALPPGPGAGGRARPAARSGPGEADRAFGDMAGEQAGDEVSHAMREDNGLTAPTLRHDHRDAGTRTRAPEGGVAGRRRLARSLQAIAARSTGRVRSGTSGVRGRRAPVPARLPRGRSCTCMNARRCSRPTRTRSGRCGPTWPGGPSGTLARRSRNWTARSRPAPAAGPSSVATSARPSPLPRSTPGGAG